LYIARPSSSVPLENGRKERGGGGAAAAAAERFINVIQIIGINAFTNVAR